jgi:very-short-patch-repair endonuclease
MTSKNTTPKMQHRAAELRRELMPAEAKLWSYLRAHRMKNVHFRRQHPIGKYVPDFCAPRKKLIIELDGSQHLDQQEYDNERTAFLESRGYRVIRFWNNEVMNDIEGVWAQAEHLETCREKLQSALEDWLVLGLCMGHKPPTVLGIELIPAEAENTNFW